MMRRLFRPAAYTLAATIALCAFVAAGSASPDPLSLTDFSAWLERVDPVDALVEFARWTGLVLAAYVGIVSLLALASEIAGLLSFSPLQRGLRQVVGLVALPALRRRLLELGAAASISAATIPTLSAAAAPTPAVEMVGTPTWNPARAVTLRADFEGFDVLSAAPEEDSRVYVVERGDTLWQIITDHYGRCDKAMIERFAEANPIIKDPNLILVGWNLTLPALDDLLPLPAPAPMPQGDATWTGVTVQRGDTLWDIVERHYGFAFGELIWSVVDANPSIDDPALIYPGQVLTLPPLEIDDGAPSTDVIPAPGPAATPTPPPETAQPTSAPPTNVEPAVNDPASVLDSPLPPPVSVVGSTDDPETPDASADTPLAVDADADDVPRPPIAQIVGWSGGAALAAAVLGLAAKRRRRLPRAERLRRPTRRAAQVGVALRATDNLTTVEWASLALRELATRLRPIPGQPNPVPRLLRLAGDEIEVVWDAPFPEVLAPWSTPDGGWSWTLSRPDDFDVRGTPHPCPAFVTIGRRGGADVLLNLETCGAVAVVGDDSHVDDLVRLMCVELGASPFADAPTVLVVGDDSAVPGEPDHVRLTSADEAAGWLRDRAESSSALLSSRRLTSLFTLRARSKPQDGHEPVVVVADGRTLTDDQVGRLIELANGDVGAVVVVRGDSPSVEWKLRLGASSLLVDPLGLELEPVGLTSAVADVIEEIVPPADHETDEEFQFEPATMALVDAEAAPFVLTQLPDEVEVDPDDEDYDVELKVLGQVRAIGTKQPLTPTELHLAIYLAFHRNGENADTISTMIWPDGASPKTLVNTMASLRRKLGTGSDGQMLFPLGRDNQYTYRLSDRVVTDWDRFVALARRADVAEPDEAIALLERAVDLIDGPPFRASAGYSWAYSDGTASSIVEQALRVGETLLRLQLEREMFDSAARAGGGLLRLVDSLLDARCVVEQTARAFEGRGNLSEADRLRAAAVAAGG